MSNISFKNDFLSRLFVALGAGLVGVFLAWYSSFTFMLVFAFFASVALWEFFNLVGHGGYRPYKIVGYGLATVFFLVAYFMPLETFNNVIILSFLALFLLKIIQSKQTQYRRQMTLLVIAVFGGLYIGGALSFAIGLQKIHEMKFKGVTPYDYLFLVPFVGAWATDTGAYLTGKLLGKDKLAPTISEKKTVEGLIGGIASSLAAMYIFGKILHLPLPMIVILGILLPLFCTAGDLFESSLKRRFDVKDSGALLKAHGGVLDRFDGAFFVLPLAYVIIYYFYIRQS
jgi:phosphatidate cytidylyltransferase